MLKIVLALFAIITLASLGTSSGLILGKKPEELTETQKTVMKITAIANPSGVVVCAIIAWMIHSGILASIAKRGTSA